MPWSTYGPTTFELSTSPVPAIEGGPNLKRWLHVPENATLTDSLFLLTKYVTLHLEFEVFIVSEREESPKFKTWVT